MRRFIEDEDRNQSTLLPERPDDYIAQENPVRVIDVLVDEIDLGRLGFAAVEPETTGRPAYHPSTLLKLYAAAITIKYQTSLATESHARTCPSRRISER